jgi:tRNA(His) 5'-end guanylyltransferase
MKKPLWKELGYPKPKSEASKGRLSFVENEIFSGITIPEMPCFVRLDGRCFHGFTKKLRFKEPYDEKFAGWVVETAKEFFIPFDPVLAYLFSDEINLLFLKRPGFERVEKIDSVLAGIASSKMLWSMGKKKGIESLSFDCRVIPVRKNEIQKYLIWRQAEAWRNCNNAYAQWVLLKSGKSPRSASRELSGLKIRELQRVMKKHGFDIGKTPAWQRRGILLYKESYKKKGYDPIKKKKVVVERRRAKADWNPPLFNKGDGRKFLKRLLER